MFQLNKNEALKKLKLDDLSDKQKKDIIEYLETHSQDTEAFKYIMNEYNISMISVIKLVMQNIGAT